MEPDHVDKPSSLGTTSPTLPLHFPSAILPASTSCLWPPEGFLCDRLHQAGVLEGGPYYCVSVELVPLIAEQCPLPRVRAWLSREQLELTLWKFRAEAEKRGS